jgi:uncharacterized protein YbaR (Trm112 family)
MEQIVNREGLGLNTADGMKYFRQNIKEVVENYAKSDTQEDLAFTSDLQVEGELICEQSELAYPIIDGIPVLLAEEARKIN